MARFHGVYGGTIRASIAYQLHPTTSRSSKYFSPKNDDIFKHEDWRMRGCNREMTIVLVGALMVQGTTFNVQFRVVYIIVVLYVHV
jgi:hypothetical protein